MTPCRTCAIIRDRGRRNVYAWEPSITPIERDKTRLPEPSTVTIFLLRAGEGSGDSGFNAETDELISADGHPFKLDLPNPPDDDAMNTAVIIDPHSGRLEMLKPFERYEPVPSGRRTGTRRVVAKVVVFQRFFPDRAAF
ncbi:MAG: hypothetical protein DRH37_11750 [Deltaproteobacteria bacterium]|nr:MAG: hypothetical protein DRH37_11750 [Deltaproteobacteria bacterium]